MLPHQQQIGEMESSHQWALTSIIYVGYNSRLRKGGFTLVYITVKQPPIYHQMTLEEFLFQTFQGPAVINENMTNTRTYEFESASAHFTKSIDVDALAWTLARFNQSTEELREKERISLSQHLLHPQEVGRASKNQCPQSRAHERTSTSKDNF